MLEIYRAIVASNLKKFAEELNKSFVKHNLRQRVLETMESTDYK